MNFQPICLKKKVFIAVLIILLSSCVYHEQEHPLICDCTAPVTENFKDVASIVVDSQEGYLLLSPYKGYLHVCNETELALQQDGLLISASGELKSTCIRKDDYMKRNQESFSILNDWELSPDSSFTDLPISIRIIRSEDFGSPVGFGYDIQKASGFHILQPIIPAVGGNQTFKTELQAYKVAVLVAYKMTLDFGLPAITEKDLDLLKIEYIKY
jgi:hypothetical protein